LVILSVAIPKGTFHKVFPEVKSVELRYPHGGFDPGNL